MSIGLLAGPNSFLCNLNTLTMINQLFGLRDANLSTPIGLSHLVSISFILPYNVSCNLNLPHLIPTISFCVQKLYLSLILINISRYDEPYVE